MLMIFSCYVEFWTSLNKGNRSIADTSPKIVTFVRRAEDEAFIYSTTKEVGNELRSESSYLSIAVEKRPSPRKHRQ